MEAIAAFTTLSDKTTVKDMVSRIMKENSGVSPYIMDRIASRLIYDVPPLIN
jgi:hypothetical protein